VRLYAWIVKQLAAKDDKDVVSRGIATVLLLTSALMAFIGVALLMWYQGSLSARSWVFYPALYLGVFDFVVCIFCFFGGVASLKGRFFPLTLTSVVLLLVSGIAAFIAGSWFYGVLFGLIPLVVSIAVLAVLVKLKMKK
jgi:hypothetical protein